MAHVPLRSSAWRVRGAYGGTIGGNDSTIYSYLQRSSAACVTREVYSTRETEMIMKSVCDVRLPIVCVVRCLCVMGYQGHPTAYVVTQSKCFILHQTAVTQRTDLAWGASQTADSLVSTTIFSRLDPLRGFV